MEGILSRPVAPVGVEFRVLGETSLFLEGQMERGKVEEGKGEEEEEEESRHTKEPEKRRLIGREENLSLEKNGKGRASFGPGFV